jgi:hypothetical protein
MRAGQTRANLFFRSDVWYLDLVSAVVWIDTELLTMADHKSKYRVVGNSACGSIFNELRPRLERDLQQSSLGYWE